MLPHCLQLLQNPASYISNATADDWTTLIQQARQQALLGSCYFLLLDLGLYNKIPEKVQNHLLSGAIYAEKQKITLHNELAHLEKFFAGAPYPCVLLKGTAYHLANVPLARGRVFSDIDLLVPQVDFPDALERLNQAGFIEFELSDYDRQYYLRWSHQHPPLIHFLRGASVDLHHHIYPVSSGENVLVEPILQQAVKIPASAFALPTGPQLFIHAAVHLFYQDESHKLCKDLWDLYQLYQHNTEQHSLQSLVTAGIELNAGAALYYALDILHWLFDIPLDEDCRAALSAFASHRQRRQIRWLLQRLLDNDSKSQHLAASLWIIRGHLLKMGPVTLLYHSLAKSWQQLKFRKQHTERQKRQDAQARPEDAGLL